VRNAASRATQHDVKIAYRRIDGALAEIIDCAYEHDTVTLWDTPDACTFFPGPDVCRDAFWNVVVNNNVIPGKTGAVLAQGRIPVDTHKRNLHADTARVTANLWAKPEWSSAASGESLDFFYVAMWTGQAIAGGSLKRPGFRALNHCVAARGVSAHGVEVEAGACLYQTGLYERRKEEDSRGGKAPGVCHTLRNLNEFHVPRQLR
jgi:hypothetical protein